MTATCIDRRSLVLAAAALALPPFAAAAADFPAAFAEGVTLVYLGARDCPHCQAFMRDQVADLRQRAADKGVRLVERETASLRDLRKDGVFDELNPVWLKVLRRSGSGVPAFALIDAGTFVDSRAGEWRDLLVLAIARARKASAS